MTSNNAQQKYTYNIYYTNPDRPHYMMSNNGFECKICHFTTVSNNTDYTRLLQCPQCRTPIFPKGIGHRRTIS